MGKINIIPALPIMIRHSISPPPKDMPHSHIDHEIYYFHGGKCNFIIGSSFYMLEPGDLIIMDGLTLHSFIIDPQNVHERTVIHLKPDYLQSLIPPSFSLDLLQPFAPMKHHRLSLKSPHREQFEDLLRRLESMQESPGLFERHRFQVVLLEFFLLLYELCQSSSIQPPQVPSFKEDTVLRIMAYLDEHYSSDLHLEELQEHFHISGHYLVKLFKDVTGMTIFHYLTHLRVNHAKVKLRINPDETVLNISYQTGFKHHAHFSRVFKQIVGCSPAQFRKSLLPEQ